MPLLIAVLLGLSGLIIVIYPLLGLNRNTSHAQVAGPLAEVAERERSARDALREVEFDHRLGNLDNADYQALRTRYERRALTALKSRYQREQELDALIEQELDALRQQESGVSGVSGDITAPKASDKTTTQSSHMAGRNGANAARGPQVRRRRGGRI